MATSPRYPDETFFASDGTSVTVSGECEINTVVAYGANVSTLGITVNGETIAQGTWSGNGVRVVSGGFNGNAIAIDYSDTTTGEAGSYFPRFLQDGDVVAHSGGDSIAISGVRYL